MVPFADDDDDDDDDSPSWAPQGSAKLTRERDERSCAPLFNGDTYLLS